MDKLIERIARMMFFGEIKCDPGELSAIWGTLSLEEKRYQIERVQSWLEELEKTSPNTYKFIMENYDNV